MAPKSPVVDSHQHFWDLQKFSYPWMSDEMQVLKRNYLPADLQPLLDQAGVDCSVVVQAQHNLDESRWVLDMAADNARIAGHVGWLDLCSPDLEQQIAEFKPQAKFVGVRHVVHDEPDERWLLRDDVVRGLNLLAQHQLPYDLLLFPVHLKHIPELIRRVPDLPMVIDHLSKPLIAKGEMEPWRKDLAAVAQYPQICCKVSGMITEADHKQWQPADLVPYIDVALELFGPERLMYGSDWPVCRLAGEYQQVIDAARNGLSQLSSSEQAAVFGENAVRFYGLNVSA
jgi:L-fuconolactonase